MTVRRFVLREEASAGRRAGRHLGLGSDGPSLDRNIRTLMRVRSAVRFPSHEFAQRTVTIVSLEQGRAAYRRFYLSNVDAPAICMSREIMAGARMLTDEATIMHAVAVLAAAQYSVNKTAAHSGAAPSFNDQLSTC